MQIKSVADHLLYTALKTPHPQEKALLMPGAHDLAKCKRMSYDMTALEAVNRSREEALTAQILSNFKICKLPFNNVWLEGPHPASEDARKEGIFQGFILKSLPDEGFSIQMYTTIHGAHEKELMFRRRGYSRYQMDINDVSISPAPDLKITVNSNRIDLDDDNLLKNMQRQEGILEMLSIEHKEIDDKITRLFNTADFIARLIVMMNSKPLGIEGAEAKDRDEIKNDRQIQSAFTVKVPREVDVRPIKIDLARVTKARLQALRSDEPRDNQGITSVCGHMCYPKKREPYWMPPCDRAKLLPGDNRDAERQLRSTQEKLSLAIQSGVPTRVIQRAEASLKKFSI